MASIQKSGLSQLRWLLLLPIPVLWCVLGADQGLGERKDPLTRIERFLKIDPGYQSRNGALTFIENKLIDLRFRVRGPIPSPVKIVYVDLDEKSFDIVGGWPWSREYFAEASKALLDKGNVKAIGMDFLFSDKGVAEEADKEKLYKGNRELGKFLNTHPEVVVGASYTSPEEIEKSGRKITRTFPFEVLNAGPVQKRERPEIPSMDVRANQSISYSPPEIGLIDTINSGTRWVPLYARTSFKTYYHLAVELARLYYGVDPDGVRIEDTEITLTRPDGSVAATIPLDERQLTEINWFSHWDDRTYDVHGSLGLVWFYASNLNSENPRERADAQEYFSDKAFKDSIVLIGPVNRLLHDVAPTSVDNEPVPKVSVHGNLLKTIISGRYLRRLNTVQSWAIVLALTGFVTWLAMTGGRLGVELKVLAALIWVGYLGLAFWVFGHADLILPMTAPLLSAFTTCSAGVLWQLHEQEKKTARVKGLFGTYLAPAIVDQMVNSGKEPELGGVEEKITAYFSDIVGFSTFSELLSPQQLTELLNQFLTACTDIIQADGGTLDKYIGDAVVAIYGAPYAFNDHGYRACVSALKVQAKIAELREKWKHEDGKWPEIVHKLQTRIGLNSGAAVVGNMGSATRFAYTMMGDNVNLAARMESGAKKQGVFTMCTEATKAECEKHGGDPILFRPLGKIVVMGRSTAVPIFEVMAVSEGASDSMKECVDHFQQGLAKFYARDWAGAIGLFERSAKLEPNQPGVTPGVKVNPSLLYIEKAGDFKKAPPPPDWDGVEHMSEK